MSSAAPITRFDRGRALDPHGRIPRSRRACPARRPGFTLVELLVVVLIISILAALILPAITTAMESARRADCTERMHQLALHVEVFENEHNRFPGWIEYPYDAINPGTGQPYPIKWFTGWIPALLPQMRQDLVDPSAGSNWRRPTLSAYNASGFPTTVNVGLGLTNLTDMVVCPSDPVKMQFDYRTSAGAQPLTSYVINCGRADGNATQDIPHDWPANAVFLNMRPDNVTPGGAVGTAVLQQTKTYITKNDGLNTTLMISESLDPSITWSQLNEPVEANTGFLFQNAPFPASPMFDGTMAAHPSSNHPNGVNVVFAGGNFGFLNQKISYQVYAALMTPNGRLAKEPGSLAASNAAITNPPPLDNDDWQ